MHLVNDPALMIGAGPAHIPLLALRYLRSLAGRNVVGVDVEMAVAIGVVVNRVPDPHRVA